MDGPATQAIVALWCLIEETGMQSASGAATPKRCAYCQEPFCFSNGRPRALPAGDQFVCNEFCAQALREEAQLASRRAS
jgi:hypothetical protein